MFDRSNVELTKIYCVPGQQALLIKMSYIFFKIIIIIYLVCIYIVLTKVQRMVLGLHGLFSASIVYFDWV